VIAASSSALARELCDAASQHLERGDPSLARELLARALSADPSSALVHYKSGVCSLDLGLPGLALDAFDTSIRLDPGNAKAHNNRGSALQLLGRTDEAAEAFRRAIMLDSTLAPPYVNLGYLMEHAGRPGDAVSLYDEAIASGLDRNLFEQHRAAALGITTAASPESWVRSTFDNFAPMFDARLAELEYQVPRDLATRLAPLVTGPLDILDLGCGTGGGGLASTRWKRSLVGVDLSPKMLQAARKLGIYDECHEAEVRGFLRASDPVAYDLVLAADVFIYIGDLAEVFREVDRVLRIGGAFAFSTEEVQDGTYTLLASGRYAQSRQYVESLAFPNFDFLIADATTIRKESGRPLPGRLYVLRKRAKR
jgi:predicted TPR repeat methyltransferase